MKMLKQLLPVTGALVGLSLLGSAWTSVQSPPKVCFSSDLIGMKVVSQNGDDLGKIEDIVVHPGGEPSYAVLSFGGWMGMGDKLFAMPWSVLRSVESDKTTVGSDKDWAGSDKDRVGSDKDRIGSDRARAESDKAKKNSPRTLVLPLDKERLKAAPGFDKKSWPSMANADWTKDVDAFYKGDANPNITRPIAASAKTSSVTWRASELLGFEIKTPNGEKLGDIEKLAIDSNGRVSYVALDVADFVGIDDRMVAVPWDALKFSQGEDKGDKKLITLASTKQQLEQAPQFKDGDEHSDEMCDPKWITRVYEYHSIAAYTSPRAGAGTVGSNR